MQLVLQLGQIEEVVSGAPRSVSVCIWSDYRGPPENRPLRHLWPTLAFPESLSPSLPGAPFPSLLSVPRCPAHRMAASSQCCQRTWAGCAWWSWMWVFCTPGYKLFLTTSSMHRVDCNSRPAWLSRGSETRRCCQP
jgi:hypothetical protein